MLAFSLGKWEPWQVLSRGDIRSDRFQEDRSDRSAGGEHKGALRRRASGLRSSETCKEDTAPVQARDVDGLHQADPRGDEGKCSVLETS